MSVEITAPGVYDGVAEDDYFAHPALSASGAKKLLPPSCPALFKWEQEHGQAPKRAFDLGHAVHAQVLGVGAEIVTVQTTARDGTKLDATDYRTNSAKEHQAEIRKEGKVPLLAVEVEQVTGMVAAVRGNPIASLLFDPERGGQPEASLFWHDHDFGVDRRARFDWLPAPQPSGRMIVPDLKTTASAAPKKFVKSVADFHYALQGRWYMDGVLALDLAEDVAFVFVAVETTPPHLVTVFELDENWLRIGRADADQALAIYAECLATDTWPAHSEGVELLTPPAWLMRQYEDAL